MDMIETMRAFIAVAQEGSFTGAGRRLGKSTKLISNRIAALEGHMETRLFNRTTRSVNLTDVGKAYLERCSPIVEQLDELDDLVRERQTTLSGRIRMTAPTGFGSKQLSQALAPFLKANPKIEINLHLTDKRVALVEEGFDLAVRIGNPHDSTLILKKLAPMPVVTCASPQYLAEFGHPQEPQALSTHSCLIDENATNPTLWKYQDGENPDFVKVSGSFSCNSPRAIAEMAVQGSGIARSPLYAVEAYLAEGLLVRLLEDYKFAEFGLYVLYPPNRHLTMRMRALIDYLAEYFSIIGTD